MDEKHPATHWWMLHDGERHEAIWAAVEYLDETNAHINTQRNHMLRLYSNRFVSGQTAADFLTGMDSGDKIRMNVVKSCVDASVAQIATNRPKGVYLPVAGSFFDRKRAEGQGKFVSGVFHENRQYIQALSTFRDGGIFGSGWQNVCEYDGRVLIERVLDQEIILDPNEVTYGNPRTMYRVKDVDRHMLAELYPKFDDDIKAAGTLREEAGERNGLANPVTVIEAWRLPSRRNSKDGVHAVIIQNATLEEERWTRSRFSIAKWNWNDAPIGYRGIGIAEELASIQAEINYIAQKIQRLMTLATSMVWTEKGSGVHDVNNKDWGQREYRGKPPIFQTTAAVSAEYFHHLDRLYQRAFEIVGISQLQAQAKKPAGLDSGEALRTFNDIGTQRFQHTGQRWEDYHIVEIGERILDVARAAQSSGTLRTLAAGNKEVEEIDFSKVGLAAEKYIVRVQPASILPDTPAGKLQTFKELIQMAPQEMVPYMGHMMDGVPELDIFIARMKAPMEAVEKMVGHILEDGEYEPPYAQMNLSMARDVATKELLRAKMSDVPEERIGLLRQWIDEVDGIQAQAEMPPPSAGGVELGGPQPQPGNPLVGTVSPDMPPALPMPLQQ